MENINKKPVVTIEMEDGGIIKLELYPSKAPETVNNFISLVNKGFYDGLFFHRTIPGFMAQGGDPEGTGMGGPGYSIKGEFSENGIDNNISHVRGIISMARSMAPDSAGSQFFIVTDDSTFLDGQYASFGKVIEGLDVVHKASEVKTDLSDKPLNDVIIESIVVDVKGGTYTHVDKIS